MPEFFLYRSKLDPSRAITVGERDDTMELYLPNADFLTDEQNRFNSIEEIEELLDDEFEMIIRPH